MELDTLACLFTWALRNNQIETNPMDSRPNFYQTKKIRHCRENMPKDGNELHDLARHFFSNSYSEALGWQLLLEAMTGCRTSEILCLRFDAKDNTAGFFDGRLLWLHRCKSGINPASFIHPALEATLRALQQWRVMRGLTNNPYFIPSRYERPGNSVGPHSLTQGLNRRQKRTGGPKRTSHGLRAFYVAVRRSQGISDAQIAAEIGDVTGAAIIASTYGPPPPNWMNPDAKPLSWMPDAGEPAWAVLDLSDKVLPMAVVA
jgi:integrase